MKKTLCILICLCLIFAGCAKPNTIETQGTTAAAAISTTEPTVIIPQQETMYAVSVPAVLESTLAEDGTVIFTYTHQSMMLTVPDPEVANKVIIDFLSRCDAAAVIAETVRQSANANYNGSADWTPYLYNNTYSPMRMDQGVLSLFGSCVTYSGASHPERLSVSASYDLVTGEVLTLGSIMSADATTNDFCDLVLASLTKRNDAKYLYDGYEETVKQRFSKDESLDQDWYFSTTGLCFYFDPYEIAPYSSGTIVVEIPYAELSGLLYDGYFPAEREVTAGSIQATALENTDTAQFTQIGELVLDADGQMIFLHTDGIVWDVKIEYGAWDSVSTTFAPVYTALFSAALTPGDAIMIQSDELTALRLSYSNGTQVITQHLEPVEGEIISIS